MAAGGRKFFVNAYINIRVIRETHGCHLPIELFYLGQEEMSPVAVAYMEKTFANLRLIDVYSVADMPTLNRPNLKGYPVKAFAVLLSSFKEVLFLDSDSFPIENPEVAFHFPQYVKSGALFWPDLCNYFTIRPKAYDVFDLPRPSGMLVLRDDEQYRWTDECDVAEPQEWETGEIVVDKERAWKALLMNAFMCWHNEFFMKNVVHDDKGTFKIAFEGTQTPHEVVSKTIYFQGIATTQTEDGRQFFCGSGISQPHPITGKPLFIHRSQTKFMAWPAQDYLIYTPIPRAWTHIGQQHQKKAWIVGWRGREGVPDLIWLPSFEGHAVCFYPEDRDHAVIEPAADNVCISL